MSDLLLKQGSFNVRTSCSGLYSIKSWNLPKMESVQPCQAGFPRIKQEELYIYKICKAILLQFLPFLFIFSLCMLWRTWLHYVDNLVGTGMPYGVLHRLLCSLQIKTRKNNPPTTNTFSCSDCSSEVNDGCIMPTVQTLVIDSVNTANSQNSVLMQHCQYILLFPSLHMTWR